MTGAELLDGFAFIYADADVTSNETICAGNVTLSKFLIVGGAFRQRCNNVTDEAADDWWEAELTPL